MEPLYEPQGVERRWQRVWEDEGLYAAEAGDPRPTFVIAHPPPNVTGELHTGHALQLALADALVRYHRMRGFNTLFQPGYAHAGISTRNAVEKHREAQGRTRQELGRAEFERVVWDWLHEYGGKIMQQFRRMGASMDYTRERFTMDDDYIRAVMRFFVHLYRRGWIYRANRIINWCPYHETTLSDLELTHEEIDDALTYVLYPFADGDDGGVTIATARVPTILADVAVAVNPAGERGQLVKREAYRHTVALCERCKSRIEPLISLQWWCSMDEIKQPALAALRNRRARYVPESQHRFAIESLETAPDWNISRQLWWGHQLPLWYCPDGHVTVEDTAPDRCAECGSTELVRDEDVLDTWFSSALWPFATLGWPDDTPDLRTFYPGDLNTTARDIIRLWENRMIFSGLELMGEVPFRDVVIHSLLHAPAGGRMSKSLGTG